jgi:hypothetical protein
MKDRQIELSMEQAEVEKAKQQAMQDALQEIRILRQLIFNVFNEAGQYCGTNRHDQFLLAKIVQEFSKPQ